MPEAPEKDPVVSQSLAGYYLIAALLLVLSFGWSLYDEFFGLRPWKAFQSRFAKLYVQYLEKQAKTQARTEMEILNSPEYQALKQKAEEMEKAVEPQRKRIADQLKLVNDRLDLVTATYTDKRAYVTSVLYDIEHTSGERGKQSAQRDLEKYEQGPFLLKLPVLEAGGKVEQRSFTFAQLDAEFKNLQALKAQLQTQDAEVLRPAAEMRKKRDDYLQEHLNGLSKDQLEGLVKKVKAAGLEIRQINNPDLGLVDRCESCHLGTREPVLLTRKDMGGLKDPRSAAFTSHPDPDLLKIHDPEKFGCSPCHNGNGMQVSSIEWGHGNYEHWLFPLYRQENFQSGCQPCHARDMVVEHAAVLSRGKELFHWRGCMGCHRFERYDPEPEEMVAVQQQILQLEGEKAAKLREIDRNTEEFSNPNTSEERARFLKTRIETLPVEISAIDARIEQLDYRSRDLLREMKKVGPDLKEARVKLRPEWIPVWIENPHAFRPTTRMPRFRLTSDEVKDAAAFIWQSGIDAKLPTRPRGDPVKGKESFESRGCMGCHSVGEGSNAVGGTFGANLTRVGEKANYDYLVRWIHNPRERTRPYCPYERRDLTEADYQKHGLPFVFDLEHTICPNDGHELEVEQMTVMPNLRLSWQEAQDIASYLITLKTQAPASYTAAAYLNEPGRKEKGKALVRRYGCAGCHEINGFEDEGRIGTELTKEGSKPLEQFDFGLLVREASDGGWYSQKGFFEHKLEKPDQFDQGRDWAHKDPNDHLRMPNLNLKPEEITALSTFLLGSVDSQIPRRYYYLPEDQRKDIQDGWWTVKKYNCMGCHQFTMEQPSVLMTLARYQTPEGKDQTPPRLVGEGARVTPEWLARFLANPAMTETTTDRNGIRPYLKVRMPTFYFAPGEVRGLVRFFQALAYQPIPYIAPKLDPLTVQELAMARALFTSRAAPCLKCHATGDPSHDRYATAPNFLLAPERLKPGWTRRWILDPAKISPGTAMPSGLFKQEAGRWVFSGPTPPIFSGYAKDHADLLVRYMFEITPEEQRRLVGMSAGAMRAASGSSAPPVAALAKGH